MGVGVLIDLYVFCHVEHSSLQDNQSPSVGEEVKHILLKAESWVATRDGPISK